MNYSIIIY